MKPFLLIQSRPEVEASEHEYLAFLRFGGLQPQELVRVRTYANEYPEIPLHDYSGVFMGGGPANFATAEDKKPSSQKEFENYIFPLLQRIIEADTPFLGVCLGMGALITQQGGRMSYEKSEPVKAIDVVLSKSASDDHLLADIPGQLRGFVGHKEGGHSIPEHFAVLAESESCVQMVRVGRNVYATQFHPELDPEGLALRLRVYQNAGYFEPSEVGVLTEAAMREKDLLATKVLENFVRRYRQYHETEAPNDTTIDLRWLDNGAAMNRNSVAVEQGQIRRGEG